MRCLNLAIIVAEDIPVDQICLSRGMYAGTNTSEGIPIYGVFVILLIIKSFLCYVCLKKNPMYKFWLIVCVLFISLSLTNVYMVGFGPGDGVDFTDRSRSRNRLR